MGLRNDKTIQEKIQDMNVLTNVLYNNDMNGKDRGIKTK